MATYYGQIRVTHALCVLLLLLLCAFVLTSSPILSHQDVLSPAYYFLLPTGKIRDATFIGGAASDRDTHIVTMSTTGYIYSQKLCEESLAVYGQFYMTNVLMVSHNSGYHLKALLCASSLKPLRQLCCGKTNKPIRGRLITWFGFR